MGSQLLGGNSYGPFAGMARQHGGAGNEAMFNQMTAPAQYQQGLDQQGMMIQGLSGLMSALAYYHQRKQDQNLLHPQTPKEPQAGLNTPQLGQQDTGRIGQAPWSLDQMNNQNAFEALRQRMMATYKPPMPMGGINPDPWQQMSASFQTGPNPWSP